MVFLKQRKEAFTIFLWYSTHLDPSVIDKQTLAVLNLCSNDDTAVSQPMVPSLRVAEARFYTSIITLNAFIKIIPLE